MQAPRDSAHGPYPVVIFAHGYSTNPDAYLSTLQHVASWGMVVVAPEVCPLLPTPLQLRPHPVRIHADAGDAPPTFRQRDHRDDHGDGGRG